MKKILQIIIALAALSFVVAGTNAYSKVNVSFGIGAYPSYGYYDSYYPYSYGYSDYYYPRSYYYSDYSYRPYYYDNYYYRPYGGVYFSTGSRYRHHRW